ncbi:MAG TPA: glycosyltransferase family 4 protein [Steroidobacteraceae bacterium]|nr:glycosyltransferase family 4 protein [Steroidobacteraceae bacterium]
MTASPGKWRVLIIVENLPCPFDRRVWQEALALRAHGHAVSIICPKGRGYDRGHEVLEGVHIYRHPLPVEANSALGYGLEYALSLLMEFALAIRVAFTRGFDVIHACNPPDTIFLLGRFFKLFGKRFIFDHHDINPELYEAKFGRRDVWYRLLCRLERWTFAAADVSIATNESYQRIAIERGHMDPAKVFVVRSGADLTRVRALPPRPELRRGKTHLVGYVGVIGKQEGLDLLLEAVAYMRQRLHRNDVQFVIVGDGTELAAVRQLARELAVEDCVEFTGRIPDAALWEIMSTADVCVNPDRANEMNDKSTMNKILEYMALGKPIVQFDLTEGRFSAGEASLYARPNDVADFAVKLCQLLDDPERRATMGAIGRQRVEGGLAWHHQVPRLLEAYQAAMKSGRAREVPRQPI